MNRPQTFMPRVLLMLVLAIGPPAALALADDAAEQSRTWLSSLPDMRILIPRRSWLELVKFGRFGLETRLGTEWDSNEVSVTDQEDNKFERLAFTERMDLRGGAYVYDPRLLNLRLGVSLGFFQESFSSDEDSGDNDGNLLGFDAQAVFLESKPYTLRVFANRVKDTVTREFSGTSEVLIENMGGELALDALQFNSTLSYRRQQAEESLRHIEARTERAETRDVISFRGERQGAVSNIDMDYEYQEVRDEVDSRLSFVAQDASLYLRRYFGPYLEKDAQARFRVFSREGRFDNFTGKADGGLHTDHTDTLRSTFNYGFAFHDTESGDTSTHIASAGLQHRLWGSLKSSLLGFGSYASFESGDNLGYGGRGELGYSKRLPYDGRVNVDTSFSYRIDDQTQTRGEVSVFEEAHKIEDFERIFLSNEMVVLDSVFVTNGDGTVIYEEGRDYTLVEIDGLVALDRLPGGLLEDGQTIRVDYSFETAEDFEYSTAVLRTDLAFDYGWITVYLNRRVTGQDLLSGEGTAFLDDTENIVTGARLQWSDPRLTASLTAEYRSQDSKRSDFTAPVLRQALSWRALRTLTINFNANQTFAEFRAPDRETTTMLARVAARWRPRAFWDMEVFGGYLERKDDLASDETFIDTGVRVRIELGRLSIRPSFMVTNRQVGRGDSMRLRANLDIVRRFF